MLQRRPHCVFLITPKGTMLIARQLFEGLEARMQPDHLGWLQDFDWWVRLSEFASGIEFPAPAEYRESRP